VGESLEENFSFYCCAIGLFGNLVTFLLLIRHIQSRLFKKTKESNKHDLFERKHNYTIYFYLIGVCLSDLVVLVSWLINKLTITAQLDTQIIFETINNEEFKNNNLQRDNTADAKTIAISYDEFIEFRYNFSISNGYNFTDSSSIEKMINKSETQGQTPTDKPFLSVNYFIADLNSLLANDIQYIITKLTNIQGVCQVFIYFFSFKYKITAFLMNFHDLIA
jgi:hypothetical protein